MKSKKQKIQINSGQELRRLGVLIEHVDGNVNLIAEQYGELKKDIGSIKKTLDSHTEMIGDLTVGLEIVKEDLEIIKTDIELIKNSVKKKIDIDEFAALEKRVLLLEKHR